VPALPLRTVIGVTAALLLTACSSAGSSGSPSEAASATGDLATQATAYAALSPTEQETRLRQQTADLERQLVTLSGLEKQLGGPAKATAAYTAMTTALVSRVTQFRDTGYLGKFGALVRTGDTPSIGGMIFAGWMLTAMSPDALVSATNDLKPGEVREPESKNGDQGVNKSDVSIGGTLDSASLDWTVGTSANGVDGKVRVQTTIKPCPDATGTFTAKASMSASATSGGGRVGSNVTIDIEITGHLDDDAALVGYEVTTRNQAAEFGSGDNKYIDVTDTASWSGGKLTGFDRTIGRTAGSATQSYATGQAYLGMMIQTMVTDRVLKAAKQGYESGRCVALVPTTSPDKRSGLEPSSTVTITAPPRSKIDGAPAGGTVTATLTGDTSVDPSGSKVKADATFTYVAPGEKDKSASVALEARSKRGVAKATVDLDTKPGSYKVTGSIPSAPSGTTFTGTICKADKPFTVQTSGDMVGTASFSPKNATGGKVTFKGKVGNAPLAMVGNGTYTLEPPKDGGTGLLTLTWKLTIKIPIVGDQTRSGTAPLTLTPISSC